MGDKSIITELGRMFSRTTPLNSFLQPAIVPNADSQLVHAMAIAADKPRTERLALND